MWDVFFWMEQNSALRFVKIRGDCLFEDFLALISACNNGILRFTTNVTEIRAVEIFNNHFELFSLRRKIGKPQDTLN